MIMIIAIKLKKTLFIISVLYKNKKPSQIFTKIKGAEIGLFS